MDVEAIVLAGGRASRLGGIDKAALDLGGESMLDRTMRAVTGLRVVVVGETPVPPGVQLVQEEPRFAGPAAAIGAGLAEVRASYVLLLACDQPHLATVVPALLEACSGDGAVAVDPSGRRQHLMSVVSAHALRSAVGRHTTLVDLSVRALLAPLDLVEVEVSAAAAVDVDTWDDREKLVEEGVLDD